MKVAVITGASAGLGLELCRQIAVYYPEIEEYWLVARGREKLEAVASELSRPSRIMPYDLTLDESYAALAAETEAQQPDVRLLINNAGCGYLGNV